MSVEIEVKIENIEKLIDAMGRASGAIDDAASQALESAREIFVSSARSLVAVRTGFTQSTIFARRYSPTAIIVGARGAARWLEKGTRPHVIEANVGRVLRWESGGAVHFARRVHHPGTQARPFISPAIREIVERLLAQTWEAVEVKLRGAGLDG